MRLTVRQSRTPVSELAADREQPWSWSWAKTPQMGQVQRRSLPLFQRPPPILRPASAVPLVAFSRRTRHCSWSTSANINLEGQTAAFCSACSVVRASHPPPPCHATASLPTKWETHSLTASNQAAHPQLLTAGTTIIRTHWMGQRQHLPPRRKLRRKMLWPVRYAANDLKRCQISTHTLELMVWPLSAQGMQGNSPEMPKSCC